MNTIVFVLLATNFYFTEYFRSIQDFLEKRINQHIAQFNNNNDEFSTEVQDKMKKDIEEVIPYISNKAQNMGLEAYSYYFYFLPMNHAEQDKKQ